MLPEIVIAGLDPAIHGAVPRWMPVSSTGMTTKGCVSLALYQQRLSGNPKPDSRGFSQTMILGIGSDIIDIRRIERTLERFGPRFVDRLFTAVERRKSDRRAKRAAGYAKRFAAKEACAKALGTGFRHGVF